MKRFSSYPRPIRGAGHFSYVLLYLLILYASFEKNRKTID
ncbi:hypothetical protein BSBH6_00215 [Bacillus subtilis]|nr:hypothetical protein BSBH6_00215 [Bacillus subtilis]RPK26578.1 hypothetical protein BH5_00213 [Bacillus subtilis]